MNYSLVDAGGICLAVLAFVPLLLGPGLVLGELFDPFGFRQATPPVRLALATLVALAVLPILDTLATRFLGLDVALAANLTLALAAVVLAVRRRWRFSLAPAVSLALLGWLLLVLVEWIDFDIGGGLYRPFTIIDMVKHAATAQAIHDTGAPSLDPFFARPQRVGYYYFFYTLAALCQRLGGGLVDARAAVAGLSFWTGIGAFALCRTVLDRSGLLKPGLSPRTGWVLLATMAAGGTDLLMTVLKRLTDGVWAPEPLAWNEQATGWLESLLWVPHHLDGLIAAFAGMMALAELSVPDAGRRVRTTLFAGLCFASLAGLSVWIAFGAAVAVMFWVAMLVVERRLRLAGDIVASGLVAGIAAFPYLLELKAGRSPEGPPISLTVRAFTTADFLAPHAGAPQLLLRLIGLPLNYFFEFGLLFVGAALFWIARRRKPLDNEVARVLAIAALTGLLLGSFLKSNIYNNDLGWRVVLFPILGCTVWTVAYLETLWREAGASTLMQQLRRAPLAVTLLAALGWTTNAYAAFALRAYPAMVIPPAMRFMGADAADQRELRAAYGWTAIHLPRKAVLQHNPAPARAFDFGLYGANPVAVSDTYAGLYGAGQQDVDRRMHDAIPIFQARLATADVLARARRLGADALVVTADDPAWAMHADWVWRTRPLYATPRVRIISVSVLAGAVPG